MPKKLSNDAVSQFYGLKRLSHCVQYSVADLQAAYLVRVDEVRDKGGSDMEAHETRGIILITRY